VLLLPLLAADQLTVRTGNVQTVATFPKAPLTLTVRTEYHVTAADDPVAGIED
jgi:hypothetical protein